MGHVICDELTRNPWKPILSNQQFSIWLSPAFCALPCYLYSFGMIKLGGRKSKCLDPWQCWSLATFLYNLSFLVSSYDLGKWFTLWYDRSEENVCGLGWEPVQSRLKSLLVADTSVRPWEDNSELTNHVSLWAVRKVRFKALPTFIYFFITIRNS